MKTYILSPNVDTLFTDDLKEKLAAISDLTIVKDPQDFNNIPGLMEDNGDKVLAIDPDFCDWKVPNEIIDIPNLKAICLQTTSFSWIDTEYAKTKSVSIMNLRGFSSIAVAEYAITMALFVARKLPLIMKNGWEKDYNLHQGIEFQGKTVGIVGLGSIGKTIAQKCQGMGMNVIYYSKNSRDDRFQNVDLETLMKTADVIFPTVAQNAETKGIITDEMLSNMKSTAIFISIVHHVYNHELLLKLAAENKIFGYTFEGSDTDINKYSGNVWSAPEVGWCTNGSMTRNGILWVESILAANKLEFPTKVN